MIMPSLFIASLAAMAISQAVSPCQTAASTTPGLTMYFTPSLPVQVAPLSTAYGAIVTSYLNVVDCRYVHVQNVDYNPPKLGQFYRKTMIPMLTIYRVGCMPETTAVTRRDLRGEETNALQLAEPTGFESLGTGKDVVLERSSLAELLTSLTISQNDLGATYGNLTVTQGEWIQQINTAVWTLNVIFSGMNLTEVCDSLGAQKMYAALTQADLDANAARDVICFVSDYGISLSESLTELLRDLEWLAYAIASSDPGAAKKVCDVINVQELSLLGVDVNAIAQALCGFSIATASTTTTQTTTVTPGWGSWNATYTTINGTVSSTGKDPLTTASETPKYSNSSTSAIVGPPVTAATLTSSTVTSTGKANVVRSPTALPWHYARRKNIRHNLQ